MSPYDICACGHDREEHSGAGLCTEYHAPKPCTSFRLCATAEDIQAGYAEWVKIREERGDD